MCIKPYSSNLGYKGDISGFFRRSCSICCRMAIYIYTYATCMTCPTGMMATVICMFVCTCRCTGYGLKDLHAGTLTGPSTLLLSPPTCRTSMTFDLVDWGLNCGFSLQSEVRL